MICSILRVHRSKLKRIFNKHNLDASDYLSYNNRYLIKEQALISLIESIVVDSLNKKVGKCVSGNEKQINNDGL